MVCFLGGGGSEWLLVWWERKAWSCGVYISTPSGCAITSRMLPGCEWQVCLFGAHSEFFLLYASSSYISKKSLVSCSGACVIKKNFYSNFDCFKSASSVYLCHFLYFFCFVVCFVFWNICNAVQVFCWLFLIFLLWNDVDATEGEEHFRRPVGCVHRCDLKPNHTGTGDRSLLVGVYSSPLSS